MIARFAIALASLLTLCACAISNPTTRSPASNATGPKPARISLASVGDTEPTIRVRVARRETQVSIEAERGMDITANGSTRYGEKQLSVSADGATISAAIGGETLTIGGEGITVRPAAGGVVVLGGVALGGELRIVPSENERGIDVIEHIGLETYLQSVLAKELYPGWEAEAYRAQAIAARSYALHERARQRGLGSPFDVESTVQDQAYGGASTHVRARRAAVGTRGVVMRYAGDVLRAYYSSTCGGRSASARDVWPVHEGYRFNLASPIQTSPRNACCSASPRYRWVAERDRDALSARLRAFGAANGKGFSKMKRLASVRVIERNVHSRIVEYEIKDTSGGRWRVKQEDLRNACNFKDAKGLIAVEKKAFVYSGDMVFEIGAKSVLINGQGFGHGVGMCQYGAQGYAKKGWHAERILRHYYPGATIVSAYE